MLIPTGARKKEMMDARWSNFDFDRHQWRIPVTKSGRSIYEVQKILGHASIVPTQRYAHLSQHTLLEAANTVGNMICSALGVTPKTNGDDPASA